MEPTQTGLDGSRWQIAELDTNEQVENRAKRLDELEAKGFRGFGNGYLVTHTTAEIIARFEALDAAALEALPKESFCIAGRLVLHRCMGKSTFFHLQDSTGRLQVFGRANDLPEATYENLLRKADLGDIYLVEGTPFRTKTGELSLHATRVELVTKALRPPPEKWHGLSDVEVRYRQRYADLFSNEAVRATFRKRSKIIAMIREYFNGRGYLEVETPMMHPSPGGANARPFITHHNALDMQMYLRIAPELYLKRLVVGGLERVYEINRNFRNEGVDSSHNPEFTMIEFYEAYATYEDMMALTEDLLSKLALEVTGSTTLTYQGTELSMAAPFRRLPVVEAVREYLTLPESGAAVINEAAIKAAAGKEFHELAKDLARNTATHNFFEFAREPASVARADYREKMLIAAYTLFETLVEPTLIQPTFVIGFPTAVSPLARRNDKNPDLTDRFELFINGKEIANSFSELNDPADQAERFREQLRAKARGDDEAMSFDADYIRALQYGMPPAAGEGIGIDRLVMLLTDAPSIRDVILFPLMRPEDVAQAGSAGGAGGGGGGTGSAGGEIDVAVDG